MAGKTTKQRRHCFDMRGRLLFYITVFDGGVSIPKLGEDGISRGKPGNVAKNLPCCHAHGMVVTTFPCRRKNLMSRPLLKVGRQPLGQVFSVRRGYVESLVGNPEQRQHRTDTIHQKVDVAGPPVADICESRGIDFRSLHRCLDLLPCRALLAGKRPQYEPKVLEEVLPVEHRLCCGSEALVILRLFPPYGQHLAG